MELSYSRRVSMELEEEEVIIQERSMIGPSMIGGAQIRGLY